jgi:hypothetical protein
MLGRVGFLMLRDGSLEIKGTNCPDLTSQDVKRVLDELEESFQLKTFEKPDYFASASFVEGLTSSEEFRKKGMQIHCLNSRLIYPLYGVYMPTQ